MSARNRAAPEEPAELNLTPIMSILVLLIPILLFAFTFHDVRMQAAASPRMVPGGTADSGLGLTVRVSKKGFEVKIAGESRDAEPSIGTVVATAETTLTIARSVSSDGLGHDFPGLYRAMANIKARHPEARAVQITAEPDIPWRLVARTMDAIRLRLPPEAMTDDVAFSTSDPLESRPGEVMPMFDKVSFAVSAP